MRCGGEVAVERIADSRLRIAAERRDTNPQWRTLPVVVPIRWDADTRTTKGLTAFTVHPFIAMPPPEALLHKHMAR